LPAPDMLTWRRTRVIGVVIPVDVATFAWPNCYEPDDAAAVYAAIIRMLEEDGNSTGAPARYRRLDQCPATHLPGAP
jgi:hypothetical protein